MSRKAKKEASLNYTNITFAFLALGMISVAAILPYWLSFPADYSMRWPQRQWGLLKVSGQYTNAMLTGADIAWFDLRDTVCGASAAWATGSTGASSTGLLSAVGNSLAGVNCRPMCKSHISQRCTSYYRAAVLNLVFAGLLVGGCLVSLIGSAMPLIGKERKKDRTTWLLVDVLGFVLAAGGLAAMFFFYSDMFKTFKQTSYFQAASWSWCFFLAVGGVALLLFPPIIQMYKIKLNAEKKPAGGSSAQLLTSGVSPDFMMPTAI